MNAPILPARQRVTLPAPSLWRMAARRWLTRLSERDEMARMSVRELRDARLTPYDVACEQSKPFWRE